MPKYVINEQGDLAALANEVKKIAENQGNLAARKDKDEVAHLEDAFAPAPVAVAAETSGWLSRAWVLAGSLGLVLALILVAVFINIRRAVPPSVPNVVGMKITKAQTIVEKAKLRVTIEYDNLSTKPSGTVITTVPAARTKLRPGSEVTLRVAGKSPQSPSPRRVAPPEPKTSSPTTEPTPVTAMPDPKSAVTPPTAVSPPLTPPTAVRVTVPALEGMKVVEAQRKLIELRLRYQTWSGIDAKKENGTVLACEPNAGTEVAPGSMVRLQVNTLPNAIVNTPPTATPPNTPKPPDTPRVRLPNVVGAKGRDAIAFLQERGFTVTFTMIDTADSRNVDPNTVMRMEPPAGSMVIPRSRVILELAR